MPERPYRYKSCTNKTLGFQLQDLAPSRYIQAGPAGYEQSCHLFQEPFFGSAVPFFIDHMHK